MKYSIHSTKNELPSWVFAPNWVVHVGTIISVALVAGSCVAVDHGHHLLALLMLVPAFPAFTSLASIHVWQWVMRRGR